MIKTYFLFHPPVYYFHVTYSYLNLHVISISSFFFLKICQLSTSLTFSLSLFSYVVSVRDVSRDIFPFILSIPFIILVPSSLYYFDYFTILKAPYLMGQPAHLKEDLVIDSIKSFTKIALRVFRPCCSSYWSFPFINNVKDELARDQGPTKSSHLGSTSPVPSCNPILGPTLVSAPIFALASALYSSDKLFRQFIKAYLESNQGPSRSQVECKQSLKAKVPDVYYGKSHMDCYHFCQQCKNYFETVEAIGANRTLFTAFFLYGNISVY